MAKRAGDAGALFFSANPLFLKPCSRETYFGFIGQHFPELAPQNKRHFGQAEFLGPEYSRELSVTVKDACRRYGLRHRSDDEAVTVDGQSSRSGGCSHRRFCCRSAPEWKNKAPPDAGLCVVGVRSRRKFSDEPRQPDRLPRFQIARDLMAQGWEVAVERTFMLRFSV